MTKKANRSVFEIYADEYDIITNAAERENYHRDEVKAIIERFNPTCVLDAGCATGLTAKLFAQYSIPTVGLDRSRAMLRIATNKHRSLGNFLTFRYGNFERLPKSMHSQFDLIVCLANSISGVGSVTNLRKSIRNFYAVLKPGGVVLLQTLNYTSMKEGDLLPIKATEHQGIIYERFSERRSNRLYVYFTRLDLNQKPPALEIFRHQFDNFFVIELTKSLRLAGFSQIKKYSDLYFNRTFAGTARDLVITGKKPSA